MDAHVGEHIFRELIQGFLLDRTRILVSHNLALAVPAADKVLCLDPEYGSVFAQCNPTQLPYAIRAYHKKNKLKLGMFYSRLIEIVEHNVTTIKEGKKMNNTKAVVNASPRSRQHKKAGDKKADATVTEELSTISDSTVPPTSAQVLSSTHDGHVHTKPGSTQSHHHHHHHSPSSPHSPSAHPRSARGRSRSCSLDPVAASHAKDDRQVDIEAKGVGAIGLDVYWIYFKVFQV